MEKEAKNGFVITWRSRTAIHRCDFLVIKNFFFRTKIRFTIALIKGISRFKQNSNEVNVKEIVVFTRQEGDHKVASGQRHRENCAIISCELKRTIVWVMVCDSGSKEKREKAR